MGKSEICIDGLRVRVDDGNIIISKTGSQRDEKDVIKDTVIKGDYSGNIRVAKDDVKIIIEGNMFGDIVGNCNIEVKGKIQGDIVGNVNIR